MAISKTIQKSQVFGSLETILPYITAFVSGILMLTVGTFLVEQIAFFNTKWDGFMNDTEFYMSLAAFYLSFACFYFISKRFMHTKAKPSLIVLLSVAFIGNMVAIFCCKESEIILRGNDQGTYEFIYLFSTKIRDIFVYSVTCVMMYCLLAIFPQITRSTRTLSFLFFIFVIITVVAIILSIAWETPYYLAYFDGTTSKIGGSNIKSFTNNENSFATMLLLAMFAIGYLQCQRQHFWNYILLHIFYLWMCFLSSHTGLLLSTLFLVVFLLYRFFHCLSKHLISHIIGLIIYAAFISLIISIFHAGFLPQSNPLFKFLDRLDDVLKAINNGRGTLHGRLPIWNAIFSNVRTPVEFIFGKGESHSWRLINAMMYGNQDAVWSAHNGYIHLFYSGGFLRLGLYVILIVYLLCLAFDSIGKNKENIGFFCLLCLGIISIHGLVETTAFFIADTKNTLFLLLFALPLLIDNERRTNPAIMKQQERMMTFPYIKFKFHKSAKFLGTMATTVSTLLFVFPHVYLTLLRSNGNQFALAFDSPVFFFIVLLTPLIYGFAFYNASWLTKKAKGFSIAFLILSFASIILTFILRGLCFLPIEATMAIAIAVLTVVLIVSFVQYVTHSYRISHKFKRVLLDFLLFLTAFLGFGNVYRVIGFDIQYFTLAYVLTGFFLLMFMLLLVTSRRNFMVRLRYAFAYFELKAHRLFGWAYAKQVAYDEAYKTGMKPIFPKFIRRKHL